MQIVPAGPGSLHHWIVLQLTFEASPPGAAVSPATPSSPATIVGPLAPLSSANSPGVAGSPAVGAAALGVASVAHAPTSRSPHTATIERIFVIVIPPRSEGTVPSHLGRARPASKS